MSYVATTRMPGRLFIRCDFNCCVGRVCLQRGCESGGGGESNVCGHIYSKSMDQPGKVVNPALGQLNRENENFPVCVVCA